MLDLNLLRVFDAMLEERSVTRAGARVGLTQSAVSHALSRLRFALNDELFVRGANGMQPTPRAIEMGPQVHAALAQLQAALEPPNFEPSTSDRRFVLAAGAYASAVMAPPLASRLATEAPSIELAIRQLTAETFERIDARRVDFILGGGGMAAPARFVREVIASESLAWLVRNGHPLAAKAQVSLDDLVAWPHVVISAGVPGVNEEGREHRGLVTRMSWEDAGAFETALAARGLTRRVAVTVPDSYAAIAVVARTDMVTMIPRRLAQVWAQGSRLTLIEPPYASPSVSISLLYLKERLAERPIVWLRDLIRSTAATI